MIKYKSVAISDGIVIAPVFLYKKFKFDETSFKYEGEEEEIAKYNEALDLAHEQLKKLYIKALHELGSDKSLLFEVHQMLIRDEDFVDEVISNIKNGMTAAKAVHTAGENFAVMMENMDDEYMKARALDFRDISNRILKNICHYQEPADYLSEPSIILADDLEPSETVAFDKNNIKGFVLRLGSANSHTAILARGMNVPALIKTDLHFDENLNGKIAVLDAKEAFLIIEPDQDTLDYYHNLIKQNEEENLALEAYRFKETFTSNGKRIKLFNNIGKLEDIEKVQAYDGEGVGLFRSEFLYMGRNDLPSEEEQFAIYKKACELMKDKTLIIRTMDIGADKKVESLNLPFEENPALGKRAIRICLTDDDLFNAQLRALIRASAYGNLAIMFPMIISCDEIKACKERLAQIMAELDSTGIPYNRNLSVGIMIETPAAVMLAEEMAEMVDFFSVGTNDLTQYTLACDRQNSEIAHLYDAKHPAVMKMLKMIAQAAVKKGIWAGICGELASDLSVTEELLSYGFTELSVSPAKTLKLRKLISTLNI